MHHQHRPPMRITCRTLLACCLAVAACGGEDSKDGDAPDTTLLTADGPRVDSAGGEVVPDAERPAAFLVLDRRIDDEEYRRWKEAERNLQRLSRDRDDEGSAAGEPRAAVRIPVMAADAAALRRAAEEVARDPAARAAIEDAGITVPDYLAVTVAVHQAVAMHDAERVARWFGVPDENVRLVRRRGDEIRRLGRHGRVFVVDGPAPRAP